MTRSAHAEPAVPTPRRESSGTLFIELEEWRGTAWNQISRSNHALAEERAEGAGAWSSPHLPTISVSALSDLRARLNESTIFINLASPTLTAAAEHMLSKQLPEEHIAAAVHALQSRGSATPLSPVRPEGSPSKQKPIGLGPGALNHPRATGMVCSGIGDFGRRGALLPRGKFAPSPWRFRQSIQQSSCGAFW